MSSSSSQDSEDDEQRKLFLSAADPDFFSDSMFNKTDAIDNDKNKSSNNVEKEEVIDSNTRTPKSERYLQYEETFSTDLKISSYMQKFAAKKLSEKIHNLVEFVEEKSLSSKLNSKKHKNRIRLLSDSNVFVTSNDKFVDNCRINMKRPEIKRRKIEPDNIPDDAKIELCCISPENIIKETEHWAPSKKNSEVFQYKSKMHGVLHYVEPETEFSKMRKKNCWSIKRIARSTK